MDLIKGRRVYVHFNPHITSSFVEALTVQKLSGKLLYFEEKDPYYAVEYNEMFFYGYSHNTAGNVIIVEKLWHLPFAKFIERWRSVINFFFRRKAPKTVAKYSKKMLH